MKSLFVFAAATAAVLASAAFATPSPDVRVGLGAPVCEHRAADLVHVGQIDCAGRMPAGD